MILRANNNYTFGSTHDIDAASVLVLFTTEEMSGFSYATPLFDAQGNEYRLMEINHVHHPHHPRLYRVALCCITPAVDPESTVCVRCGSPLRDDLVCSNRHCLYHQPEPVVEPVQEVPA